MMCGTPSFTAVLSDEAIGAISASLVGAAIAVAALARFMGGSTTIQTQPSAYATIDARPRAASATIEARLSAGPAIQANPLQGAPTVGNIL
jgi:hypothetical protein